LTSEINQNWTYCSSEAPAGSTAADETAVADFFFGTEEFGETASFCTTSISPEPSLGLLEHLN